MDIPWIQQQICESIRVTVNRLGFELVAVQWMGGQHGPLLRVTIDSSQGITAQSCGVISSAISPLLDELDLIDQRYHLEVSSPGIDRPLQQKSHFDEFSGQEIKLRLDNSCRRRNYRGVLLGIVEGVVTVQVDDVVHEIDYNRIERAHLVQDFENYQGHGEATV